MRVVGDTVTANLDDSTLPQVAFTGLEDGTWANTFQSLGGGVTDQMREATHLVTDVKLKRTIKLLSAIARGLPIVSTKWIEACKRTSTFVDHAAFLIDDRAFNKKFSVDVVGACETARTRKTPLLHGLSFYPIPGSRLEAKEVKEMVECAGGAILAGAPKEAKKDVIVLADSGAQAANAFVKKGVEVQTYDFLMTGILQQKLDHEYVLFRLTG